MSGSGIHTLKEILFEEEREKFIQLNKSITKLQDQIEYDLKNRKMTTTELNEVVDHMTAIMPEKLGPAITQTLKTQIKESQDEVVQTLYPILGQMIKKFIQAEIEKLSEKIDEQLEKAFSIDYLIIQVKSFFGGPSYSEIMLRNASSPSIEEVFIIEEGSGILVASYSRNKTLDQDMIAAMLTAIRSFVNDAFTSGDQSLEMISYDRYKIYVQSFGSHYISVVLSGVITADFKSKLDDTILKFVKDQLSKSKVDTQQIEGTISRYFKSL